MYNEDLEAYSSEKNNEEETKQTQEIVENTVNSLSLFQVS